MHLFSYYLDKSAASFNQSKHTTNTIRPFECYFLPFNKHAIDVNVIALR